MPSPEFEFGDPVRFVFHLRRRTVHRRQAKPYGQGDYQAHLKIWTPLAGDLRHGIVIGKRLLANGEVTYDYDYGTQWMPDKAEHFTAYLVATDLRRNPVYVLPEHLNKEN